jgi:hypothetical protein
MKINWNEIVKKYPKSAKLFEQKYSDFKADCKYIPGLNLAFSISNSGIYQYDTALCPSREIGFDIFYILCEKFFEENEIIIQITKIRSNPSSLLNSKTPFYVLYDFLILSNNVLYSGKLLNIKVLTNDEAKEQAIIKAFELMEGQIK